MSLVIHTMVHEGIVICVDSRTTCRTRQDGQDVIRYNDTANKIIPFPNAIVITHCGAASIKDGLTTTDFLIGIRNRFGVQSTIMNLPLRILNEFERTESNADVTFHVSGIYDGTPLMYTYVIKTKTKELLLKLSPQHYGATYDGITDVCHAIMNSVDSYENMSLVEAIDLTTHCMRENIDVFKYHNEQSIGGPIKTYVLDKLHHKCGWVQPDGTYQPDENAPVDALERFRDEQFEKKVKQQQRQRKAKKKECS